MHRYHSNTDFWSGCLSAIKSISDAVGRIATVKSRDIYSGQFIRQTLRETNSYTVPAGKKLIITFVHLNLSGSMALLVDGVVAVSSSNGSLPGVGQYLLLPAGSVVSVTGGAVVHSFTGSLINA